MARTVGAICAIAMGVANTGPHHRITSLPGSTSSGSEPTTSSLPTTSSPPMMPGRCTVICFDANTSGRRVSMRTS